MTKLTSILLCLVAFLTFSSIISNTDFPTLKNDLGISGSLKEFTECFMRVLTPNFRFDQLCITKGDLYLLQQIKKGAERRNPGKIISALKDLRHFQIPETCPSQELKDLYKNVEKARHSWKDNIRHNTKNITSLIVNFIKNNKWFWKRVNACDAGRLGGDISRYVIYG